ncbi:hypothetical protein KS4_16770 [Poriferisphaera corsica]|uniref:HEAT repeat domain-containing protein n=1 Tax=Poriferisphaera corsica TaxID=2528020 RepID=A0A517YTR3_9BACT|nr:hypothetical protein [Poriferisphaera corsica]QDU33625.1 hypothetical protein KS4_16770 [Poriferisphaera corsica]
MQRPFALMLGASIVSINLIGGQIASVSAQQQDSKSLWADFNHYVLIARPDLAQAAGQALLEQVNDATLLKIVEEGDYKNYEQNLLRAARVADIKDVAQQLDTRIQAARTALSRNADRIAEDIELLAQGQRQYRNAVARLTNAGQYAAPQLLETLRDDTKTNLHPYVVEAMIAVGQPMVTPLTTAITGLDPVTQAQVAQILAEIGYPQAMPQLKEVIENPKTDASAKQVAKIAFEKLANSAGISTELDAANLYFFLGQQQYNLTTKGETLMGYDPSSETGILWQYTDKLGLLATPVPGEIYGDILAMRSAKRALEINNNLDNALSLYLTANLRRENKLADGAIDPSYGPDMQPASYYGMLAGPDRMHDVLAKAILDRDATLALDAIDILSQTAGTDALVNRGKAVQPLLAALSYPDARVRFSAAVTLANARPEEAFNASFRVVPILAEAIRSTDVKTALVIAKDQESLNSKIAMLSELGYDVFGGTSYDEIKPELNKTAAVDLLFTDVAFEDTKGLYELTNADYKLGAVPFIVATDASNQVQTSDWASRIGRVFVTVNSDDAEGIRTAVETAAQAYAGEAISEEEATENALDALAILYDMALGSDAIFNVTDAQAALVAALSDARLEIAEEAASVLALMNDTEAQRAIAQAALEASGDLKLALFDSLAESANAFGNQLTSAQAAAIHKLAQEGSDEVAITAAKTYGALAMPTSEAVKAILK